MPTTLMRLNPDNSGRVLYAKLEGEHPCGSLKGNMMGRALDQMEDAGRIKKGTTIIEASSGNTGRALAEIGIQRGYKVVIYGHHDMPPAKQAYITDAGATFKPVDCSEDTELDIKKAIRHGKRKNCYHFNQFENPYQIKAYEDSLGPSIAKQFSHMKQSIDVLVGGIGTGASLIGVGNYLLRLNPDIKIYGVIPNVKHSDLGGLHPMTRRPPFKIWMDRPEPFEEAILYAPEKQSIQRAIQLCRADVNVGPGSGAVLWCAENLLRDTGNYVLLFGDSGDNYKELYDQFKTSYK